MERLSRAPVSLVLAVIRFSPVENMEEKYLPAILDALRQAGYPVNKSGKVREIVIGMEGPVMTNAVERAHWEVRSLDETRSVILGKDRIVFQEGNHQDHATLFAEIERVLGIMLPLVGELVAEQVALRYLDYFTASAELPLEKHLQSGMLGWPSAALANAAGKKIQLQQFGAQDERTQLALRVARGEFDGVFPGDLMPHAPKSRIQVAKKTDGTPADAVILDTDHAKTDRFMCTAKEAIQRLDRLHAGIHQVFMDVTTPEGRFQWQ